MIKFKELELNKVDEFKNNFVIEKNNSVIKFENTVLDMEIVNFQYFLA